MTTIILLVLGVLSCGVAWFMSAGWIDPGNYGAWLAAGLVFFIAAHLPWDRWWTR